MFGDKHVKTISENNIKNFFHCFVAFGVQKDLVNPNWCTFTFLNHSKWTKNEKDMGFETKKGF
jgi:hypothetical protein